MPVLAYLFLIGFMTLQPGGECTTTSGCSSVCARIRRGENANLFVRVSSGYLASDVRAYLLTADDTTVELVRNVGDDWDTTVMGGNGFVGFDVSRGVLSDLREYASTRGVNERAMARLCLYIPDDDPNPPTKCVWLSGTGGGVSDRNYLRIDVPWEDLADRLPSSFLKRSEKSGGRKNKDEVVVDYGGYGGARTSVGAYQSDRRGQGFGVHDGYASSGSGSGSRRNYAGAGRIESAGYRTPSSARYAGYR